MVDGFLQYIGREGEEKVGVVVLEVRWVHCGLLQKWFDFGMLPGFREGGGA